MSFERQLSEIDAVLKAKDGNREKVITFSREIIRRSGSAVLAIHKGEWQAATDAIAEARSSLEGALEVCDGQQEFYYVGPMPQAFQEYAEANIVLALIRGMEAPSPQQLRVPVESYITGLADAVGEMRRHALDSLRRDDFAEAERSLRVMEESYTALKSLDFPRAVVPNLKRKVDVNRRLVEETRGDVTLALQGQRIRESIERAMKGKEGSKQAS